MRKTLVLMVSLAVAAGILLPSGIAAADDSGSFPKQECRPADTGAGMIQAQWCVDVDPNYTLRSNPPLLELDCVVRATGPASATRVGSCVLHYTEDGVGRTLEVPAIAPSGNVAIGSAAVQPTGNVSISDDPTCHDTDGTFVDASRVFNVDTTCS